ncbi:DNA polymerase IV [Photorhabdus luminescens]|uniref:DNA polymerase IV n=1 Tax=Photorhabdus laumondii subsp. clarkei TaxID=2029685 RepID=A0A329VMA5_9GAMM|nr:DNA polymerase IV [Photorhabdus laumondii]PQQ27212.1 DNA polymerase IV [Photorhabdus luminescens]RAW93380.1 DNA polymerase IV [Photorhabdus laumondii subsp. clarkei]
MRKFIHIDMDCFFAAIEMRDDPFLKEKPIAIGGSIEERGVISTANYVARKFGIHSAMSTAKALKLCPQLKVIPPRMNIYEEVSLQVNEIFSRYTDLIEPLSLDEAYLDVTECRSCHGSATLIAQKIRQSIFEELKLTASAGIAPVKFLAKIASDMNKPNGQFVITPEQVDQFVLSLPLRKIPGVGPKTEKRLSDMGLKICADVRQYDFGAFIKELGKFGLMIWQRCHGLDDNSICADVPRKSVGVEITLPKDIHIWEECEAIIEQLYPELIRRLEKYNSELKISRQGVKFKFDDFHLTTHEHIYPVLDLGDLLFIARNTWDSRRKGRGVRLVGIHVTLLDPQLERQLVFEW